MPPERRTMVATVGLSPVPVALSVLAVRPRKLLLVHSSESATEAAAIAALLKESLRDTCDVDTASCGEAVGLRDTYLGVRAAIETHLPAAEPYVLGYAGGNTAMVTAAVHLHATAHGERPELRCYVDDQAGHLVTDNGARYALPTGLTLAQMAGLHGYALAGPHVVEHGGPVDHEVIKQAWMMRWVDDPSADRLVGALMSAGVWCDLANGEPAGPFRIPTGGDNRGGVVNELTHVAALMGGPYDEVGHSLKAKRRDTGPPVAEFDVVVRRGHRVLVIEAKSKLVEALPRTGHLLVVARDVFGSATRALLAVPGAKDEALMPLAEQLTRWNAWLPELERFEWHRASTPQQVCGIATKVRDEVDIVDVDVAVAVATRAALYKPPLDQDRVDVDVDAPSDADLREPPEAKHVVTAVGGSPLAVQSALTAMPATTRTAVTTRAAWKAHQVARLHDDPRPELLPTFSASDVQARCSALAPVPTAYVVTPGTKSSTAGMVAAALEQNADLVHVDVQTGRAHSWRHGSWPHRPPVNWAAISRPPYTLEPPPGWWNGLVARGHQDKHRFHRDALEQAVAWAGKTPYQTWFSFDPTVSWWVPLLITGTTRAVGVVAPNVVESTARNQRRYNQEMRENRSAARDVVRAAAQHLHSMIGDAGRLLVLLPPEARGVELWTSTFRRLPPPIVGYRDMADPGFDPDLVEAALC